MIIINDICFNIIHKFILYNKKDKTEIENVVEKEINDYYGAKIGELCKKIQIPGDKVGMRILLDDPFIYWCNSTIIKGSPVLSLAAQYILISQPQSTIVPPKFFQNGNNQTIKQASMLYELKKKMEYNNSQQNNSSNE